MNTPNFKIKQSVSVVLFTFWAQIAFGQGSFQNLDFEAAVISPPPAGYIPSDADNPISAADALPGWTVREDGIACDAVWGSPGLDVTSVVLISGNTINYPPIQGAYSIQLSVNTYDPVYNQSASISQTGLVPAGMHSIQFLVQYPYLQDINDLLVTLNTTPIELVPIASAGQTVTMAGDISDYAGTIAELKFTVLPSSFFGLDSIMFSPQAVPEPSMFSLFGLGLLGLGWHRRRRHLS
ncbi:MAG TPA: PEP-CTERM sorting domain-containing protein [Verrucomicrobiae bacterium]|nr:PEP-CTERM sorting domain-containing protein [Verrucomicrobiae bacterium]